MSTKGYELNVQARSDFGKNASRRARKDGQIPGVIYSKGKTGEAIFVKDNEWAVLSQHDFNLLTLIDGKTKKAVLVKEVQFNYLKNCVVHIDFQEVNLSEEVHAEIPLHLVGDAVGVARGGVLELEMHMLNVACKAQDLPEFIQVDVAALNIGDALHVKDLVLPAGIKAVADADALVVHVTHSKVTDEAPAAPVADAAAAPAAKAE